MDFIIYERYVSVKLYVCIPKAIISSSVKEMDIFKIQDAGILL